MIEAEEVHEQIFEHLGSPIWPKIPGAPFSFPVEQLHANPANIPGVTDRESHPAKSYQSIYHPASRP